MSVLTHIPEAMTLTYEYKTDILTARSGLEQRSAIRLDPRIKISMSFLADSDEEIQYWKQALVAGIDASWAIPLWHEAVAITVAITASDTTITSDFSKMDGEMGEWMLLLHPDGVTYQVVRVTLPRTATVATLSAGSIADAYPIAGTLLVPIINSYINNDSGYQPMVVNAATVDVDFVGWEHPYLEGKSASALPTHRSNLTLIPTAITRKVLDVRPIGSSASEIFSMKIKRLDYGGEIQLKTEQAEANITGGRQYLMTDIDDRQFWKFFLRTHQGQRLSFYTQTFRNDMTITSTGQPSVGGTSFVVDETSNPELWDTIPSHSELALYTADGDTQYVTIDESLTVDNGDGTHTVEFLPALTATADGSNVLRVSFLELVRLASDTVEFELGSTHHFVNLTIRTIEA